jgi:ribosomal protein S12 methylthiotransferase
MSETQRRIHFVSLGCPKNRVDSEVMLGVAQRAGYRHVSAAEAAEVIVVNTCGFIDAAKQESIETILELASHKRTGACRKLIVTGCLSQRYPEELATELPEVDHFLGSSDMLRLGDVLIGSADRLLVGNPAQWVIRASDPRSLSTRGASAYVKIAEGCNRTCSFCVIPQIRGKQRSRPLFDIVEEAQRLCAAGVLELNLISQDTVAYGRDLGDATALADLVRQVADVPGVRWVRLFYLYPETLTNDLIDVLAEHPRVVPYVDMPLQHASDPMLRRMQRGHGGDRLRQLVEKLRSRVPNLAFRTAFIVGHPGETEQEFDELLDFVRWAEFDHVGVFRYSDEASSHSALLEGKVPEAVAAERAEELMKVQRAISRRKNRARVGQSLDVLVEGVSEENEWVLVGRHAGQAPEIDGCVYLSGDVPMPGHMCHVTITQSTDYDLLGEVVEPPVPTSDSSSAAPCPSEGELVHRASDGRRVSLKTLGSR